MEDEKFPSIKVSWPVLSRISLSCFISSLQSHSNPLFLPCVCYFICQSEIQTDAGNWYIHQLLCHFENFVCESTQDCAVNEKAFIEMVFTVNYWTVLFIYLLQFLLYCTETGTCISFDSQVWSYHIFSF